MRFLLYDKVCELQKGKLIRGVKTLALSEEFFRGHFSRAPLMPAVILLESMAQLLGWGIIHAHDFELSAIVSVVTGFSVSQAHLRPGMTAEITAEILSTSASDSLGRAFIDAGGARIASAKRIIYTHFRPVDRAALERAFAYYGGYQAAAMGREPKTEERT
ncbi:MAG: hypothetical protein V1750_11060 [Acidobacteriota bacterium]